MMPQLIEKLRYLSGYSIRFIRLSGFYTKIMHSEYNESVGWISEAHPPLSCILQKFQIHAGNPRWLRSAPIRRGPSALNRPCKRRPWPLRNPPHQAMLHGIVWMRYWWMRFAYPPYIYIWCMLAAVFSSMVNLFYAKIMHSEYNENNSYSVRFIRLQTSPNSIN